MAAAKPPLDPGFAKLIAPELHEKEAPRRIVLPAPLTAGLQDAWARSYPAGRPIEHGGNLVQNQDGSFAFRPGKPGRSEEYDPDITDVGEGQTLVGVGHTHPYEKGPGGETDVSFSGEDLAHLLFSGHSLVIAQSNGSRFIVVRSAELDQQLLRMSYDQIQVLAEQVKATWESVKAQAKGSLAERADAATQAICSAFHMIYYRGKGSTLKRVDPHPRAEAGNTP